MSTATDGRRREHQVRNDLARYGWTPIMRAAASKGPADLLLGHPDHGGALVQVGSKSKRLNPADRVRFMRACDLIGALPLLAVVIPRKGITYWQIDLGPARGWSPWFPTTTGASA